MYAWIRYSEQEINRFLYFIFFSKNYKSDKKHLFDILYNLDNILVMKNMIFANTLRLVLDTGSPHEGMLQLLDDCPVNLVAEVLDGAVVGLQDHGGLVVR